MDLAFVPSAQMGGILYKRQNHVLSALKTVFSAPDRTPAQLALLITISTIQTSGNVMFAETIV